MENHIELRSQKVRNIVGKMPPALIRNGTGIFVFIFTLLIAGSLYFEYTPSYSIDSQIKISSSDTDIILYIPPSISHKITINNKVIIDFYSLQGSNNHKLSVIITHIEKEITITDNGIFNIATAVLTEDSKKYVNNFKSDGYVEVRANIFFDKTTVFKHIINTLFGEVADL